MPHAPTWAAVSTACNSSRLPLHFFNATAILAPSSHHAITSHTVGQAQHTRDRHTGGPEALLRVLYRYLTRVSDRTARLNDTPTDRRWCNDHRAVLSERLHRAVARGRGWEQMGMGSVEGEGFIRERLFPTHPCAWTPTVGPPRGRGPRPFVSPSSPSVQHCLAPPAPIVSLHRVDACYSCTNASHSELGTERTACWRT